jgi:hypothetical protein
MFHACPSTAVIPAKAGISVCDGEGGVKTEVPAFAGMTLWVGPGRDKAR